MKLADIKKHNLELTNQIKDKFWDWLDKCPVEWSLLSETDEFEGRQYEFFIEKAIENHMDYIYEDTANDNQTEDFTDDDETQ